MKFIIVTWGVISGIGKWICAASTALLLQQSGKRVACVKMDPYLQVDAGTMSPYEHGEVFVTADGGETDMDFGHYERFLGTPLSAEHSITSGKIFSRVIAKERRGDYLGKNVQIVPHVTNEIIDTLEQLATDVDVLVVEIGGTIGDIEWVHFIEAVRQLRYRYGYKSTFYIHVAPLLYMDHLGELKTKPIQNTIKAMRSAGIQPSMLMCRTPQPIPAGIKEKLSLFCELPKTHIIECQDVPSIYAVPGVLHDQLVWSIIQEFFWDETAACDLNHRTDFVHKQKNLYDEVAIGFGGKYGDIDDADRSLLESLKIAGVHHNVRVVIHKLDPETVSSIDDVKNFVATHGIQWFVMPGGFGSRGVEGMITIAQYCREHHLPYLGICLGLQVAIAEFARHVCWLQDAASTERDPETPHPVIDLMAEQHDVSHKGGTMRLGTYPADLTPGSQMARLYDQTYVQERHRHRYEVNPAYHAPLQEHGMVFSGMSPSRLLVEHIELPDHPCFIATQAHPEFLSRPTHPHPMFGEFVQQSIQTQQHTPPKS